MNWILIAIAFIAALTMLRLWELSIEREQRRQRIIRKLNARANASRHDPNRMVWPSYKAHHDDEL